MARISELHYSNAYASISGVSEFVEVALAPGEDPADFTVSFYQANGAVGLQVQLDDLNVQVSTDTNSNETVYVISADDFNMRITDPNGGQPNNYEAIALTETGAVPPQVIDFYDIGGGTTAITATGGAADGAVSENLPVENSPGQTRTSLQFNQPNPDSLVYETVSPGETGVVCFVAGGLIETKSGPRPVEMLRPGDLIWTRDDGLQPVRWIGQTSVAGSAQLAPIRIEKGTFGALRDSFVSPQHRLLLTGWQAQLWFGADEVLVPACKLTSHQGITQVPRADVTYVHVLFDRHQVVTVDGIASESFFPGDQGLHTIGDATREEVFALFPILRQSPKSYGSTCRPVALNAPFP